MDSGLWVLPPLSTLTTEPALKQKMWGVHSPSVIKKGGEWVERAKMTIETSSHIWKFYRHGELFSDVKCDRFINKYWYNENNKLPTQYEQLTGWDRQAMQIYVECYNSASKIKQELESG